MTKVQLKKHCKYLETKLLAEWSLRVRATGACAICGATANLNAHHLLCKIRYPANKFDLDNGICLCSLHHRFGTISAHRNGMIFAEFVRNNYMHNYSYCLTHGDDHYKGHLTIDELEARCTAWGIKFRRPINKK